METPYDVPQGQLFEEGAEAGTVAVSESTKDKYIQYLKKHDPNLETIVDESKVLIPDSTNKETFYYLPVPESTHKRKKAKTSKKIKWKMGGRSHYYPRDNPEISIVYGSMEGNLSVQKKIVSLVRSKENPTEIAAIEEKLKKIEDEPKSAEDKNALKLRKLNAETQLYKAKYEEYGKYKLVHIHLKPTEATEPKILIVDTLEVKNQLQIGQTVIKEEQLRKLLVLIDKNT